MLPLVFVDDNAANASADQVSTFHYICMMRLCSQPERWQLRMLCFHNIGGVPATFGSARLGLHMCGSGHSDNQCCQRCTEAGLVPHYHTSTARRCVSVAEYLH